MSYLQKKKLAFMSIVNKVKGFVRSVAGIPPLTLPDAVGEDLLDYKVYGNCVQDGTPSPEAPVVIESVGEKTDDGRYKIPIKVIGKNLLSKNRVSNTSFWGTKIIDVKPFLQNLTPGKKYRISADFICDNIPDGNLTQSTFGFQIVKKDASFETIYLAVPYNISLNETKHISATFTLPSNTTVDSYYGLYAYMNYYSSGKGCGGRIENIQIEEGTLETTYEPYKDLGTTNIYLDEPLRKHEDYVDYIDYKNSCIVRNVVEYWDGFMDGLIESEIESVKLPPIPTAKGTTTLIADTTTQPSNMDITYYSSI